MQGCLGQAPRSTRLTSQSHKVNKKNKTKHRVFLTHSYTFILLHWYDEAAATSAPESFPKNTFTIRRQWGRGGGGGWGGDWHPGVWQSLLYVSSVGKVFCMYVCKFFWQSFLHVSTFWQSCKAWTSWVFYSETGWNELLVSLRSRRSSQGGVQWKIQSDVRSQPNHIYVWS